MRLSFEWDPRKNASNKKKHGISFEEAKTSFYDANARLIADPEHSEEEDRFVLLGSSEQLRMLVASHCYREGSPIVRIISARKANKKERETYKEYIR